MKFEFLINFLLSKYLSSFAKMLEVQILETPPLNSNNESGLASIFEKRESQVEPIWNSPLNVFTEKKKV